MLLLDTHALIWLASDQTKLPKYARGLILDHRGKLLVSSISGLEIALAVKRGRLILPAPPETFIARALEQHAIQEIQVSSVIGCRSSTLPDHHNDPFDRIIIATALIHRAKILSKDEMIRLYRDIEVVWS